MTNDFLLEFIDGQKYLKQTNFRVVWKSGLWSTFILSWPKIAAIYLVCFHCTSFTPNWNIYFEKEYQFSLVLTIQFNLSLLVIILLNIGQCFQIDFSNQLSHQYNPETMYQQLCFSISEVNCEIYFFIVLFVLNCVLFWYRVL